jgi:hypothetical protein
MALLKAVRSGQEVISAEFEFDILDTMATTAGVTQALKTAAGVYDVILLPTNMVVVGGDIVVRTVSNDTGTATLAVGDSASAARYLGATSIKAAARTALVPTGYRGLGEQIRITLANANGDATTGLVTVRIEYMMKDRGTIVQTH